MHVPQVLFQARCMGMASQRIPFPFPLSEGEGGVHCAHHDHTSEYFLKSIYVSAGEVLVGCVLS